MRKTGIRDNADVVDICESVIWGFDALYRASSFIVLSPDLVRIKCLQQQHFDAIFGRGPIASRVFHEKRLLGIINQVVAQVILGKETVRKVRAQVVIGILAQGVALTMSVYCATMARVISSYTNVCSDLRRDTS